MLFYNTFPPLYIVSIDATQTRIQSLSECFVLIIICARFSLHSTIICSSDTPALLFGLKHVIHDGIGITTMLSLFLFMFTSFVNDCTKSFNISSAIVNVLAFMYCLTPSKSFHPNPRD
eukprot:320459_1